MKPRPFALCLCLLALALPSAADTLHLKDGTTLEGSILREQGDSYVVLVNVTKSIKDERIIAKADVTRIVREKPDLIAFEELEKLTPVPDLASAAEYKRRIGLLEKFLEEHRGSSKSRQTRAMIAELNEEAAQIQAGGVKINGKIIPPSEYRANAYDIDARVLENNIRSLVKEGRFLEGLRAFLVMDRDFRNTKSFSELLPLIGQVITTYTRGIEQSLGTYEQRVKDRDAGLERMTGSDRTSTERAIKEETTALENRFKAEKDAKVGWVTTHPFSKASLEDTLSFARQETSRLASLATTPPVDGGKIYRDALSTIQNAGDAAAISTAINEARTARLPEKYIEILDAAAASAAAAAPEE